MFVRFTDGLLKCRLCGEEPPRKTWPAVPLPHEWEPIENILVRAFPDNLSLDEGGERRFATKEGVDINDPVDAGD